MISNIKVSNLENNVFWEKQLTNEEFKAVKDYVSSKSTLTVISATFKPVRTNNLKNFSKDFFLPTTINHAIKIQHAVGKVFAILAAFVLDILTFPVRLITVIPRTISNAKQEEHPLREYLIAQGVDSKLLELEHVRVRLDWESISQVPTSRRRAKDGAVHDLYRQEKHWIEQSINFIELPTYEGADYYVSGSNS